MKTRWIVALIVVFVALFALRPKPQPVAEIPAPAARVPDATTKSPDAAPATSAAVPATSPTEPLTQPVPADGDLAPLPPGAPAPVIPETLEAVREALDNVQFALRDYRTVLGENPIGTNAEITKALTGDNLKQVKIPVPPGSSVNASGEMCDRWNTPYFFHQLSGKQMEIHSAGPDRTMGTGDDIVVK